MNRSLRDTIALEIEKKSVGAGDSWTDDELYAWCFSDPFGKKSYMWSLAIAEHLMTKFDIKEIYDGTANAADEKRSDSL